MGGGWSEAPQGWRSLCWDPTRPVTPAPQVRAPRLRDMGTRTRDRLAPRARPLPLCLFPPATEAAVKGVPGVPNGLFPDRAGGAAQEPAGPAGSNLLGHQGNRARWRPKAPRPQCVPPPRTSVPRREDCACLSRSLLLDKPHDPARGPGPRAWGWGTGTHHLRGQQPEGAARGPVCVCVCVRAGVRTRLHGPES